MHTVKIHQINGHITNDCRVFKKHLLELRASGELARSRLEEFIQEYRGQKDSRRSSEPPLKKQRALGHAPSSTSEGRVNSIIGSPKVMMGYYSNN